MFKVGDIITGKKRGSPYSVTTHEAIMVVTNVNIGFRQNMIMVTVLDHKYQTNKGQTHPVDPQYFELVRFGIRDNPWM